VSGKSLVTSSKAVTLPPLRGQGRDSDERKANRARLLKVLWSTDGERKLPRDRTLRSALAACDARDAWWVCEASSAGPVYLLPTVEWVQHLARVVEKLGARSVLEVAAGDGFLSRCVAEALPDVKVRACDTGAWAKAKNRMNDDDNKAAGATPFAGIRAGPNVERRSVAAAIAHHKPDLVLVSWAPPGTLVERAIRAPSCKLVLDLGVDGDVCGNGTHTWRFHKEFLEGPVEARALCRLDGGAVHEPKTRATLYYGRAHDEYGVDEGW
jgi:hypothetical protein